MHVGLTRETPGVLITAPCHTCLVHAGVTFGPVRVTAGGIFQAIESGVPETTRRETGANQELQVLDPFVFV